MYQPPAPRAFARLDPQQRLGLGQSLQQQARHQNGSSPHQGGAGALRDPGSLAQLTGQMHQQQPGLLGQLLGGAPGAGAGAGGAGSQGMLDRPIARPR
jgi:hypothetical protein